MSEQSIVQQSAETTKQLVDAVKALQGEYAALRAAQDRAIEYQVLVSSVQELIRQIEAGEDTALTTSILKALLENGNMTTKKSSCNCFGKAPTVPVFRDFNQHLDDCPMKDSGEPVSPCESFFYNPAKEAEFAALRAERSDLKAEVEELRAACSIVLAGLEWSGDGYTWNPTHGDYRERVVDSLQRGTRAHAGELTSLRAERDRLAGEVDILRKRTFAAEAKAAHSLANNLCPDHRDKQQGKPCLACEIERLQRKLDAADARTGLDY